MLVFCLFCCFASLCLYVSRNEPIYRQYLNQRSLVCHYLLSNDPINTTVLRSSAGLSNAVQWSSLDWYYWINTNKRYESISEIEFYLCTISRPTDKQQIPRLSLRSELNAINTHKGRSEGLSGRPFIRLWSAAIHNIKAHNIYLLHYIIMYIYYERFEIGGHQMCAAW